MNEIRAATSFWDREVIQPTHASWMGESVVREYINRQIDGPTGGWPLDWFQREYPQKFDLALSIGCGTGALERDLVNRGVVERIHAIDGSVGSLAEAGELARVAGAGARISYFAADFNMLRLPRNTYDAVFFHQSLHHVARVERLLASVLGALKRNGLLYLDEYVGPSRTEWTFQKLRIHSAIFALLPEECRVKPELDLPIQPDDPSEAVRSGEIMKLLEVGFRIDQKRDYGGNLLSVLYPAINWAAAPSGLLGRLIAAEEAVLATGEPSYHAVVVAKPATGVRAVAATAKYYVIRKMRGLRLRVEGMKSRI